MGITNQDIADWLKENCEAQRQATQMFTATVDRFIEHDRENHAEFRQAIVLLQAEVAHHKEELEQEKKARAEDKEEQRRNWNKVWLIAVSPVLVIVVESVVRLIIGG